MSAFESLRDWLAGLWARLSAPYVEAARINALVRRVIARHNLIFGKDGFKGTDEQYDWLLLHYGFTRDEYLKWQYIADDEAQDDLNPRNANDAALIAFFGHDENVVAYLNGVLEKLDSSEEAYVERTA